jgi:hypothetical protein
MSERTTAQIVADLRNWRTLVVQGDGIADVIEEAADRLAELDAQVAELDAALRREGQ